ncbi:hypothetical protein AB0H57_31655 [Micromonospora sp. NPDC050686]|uniref:hypothetical protein n=1 Tax=Micromonospora sp. NPDC050686 TaxID=3154631 RepID=UPI0034111EC1
MTRTSAAIRDVLYAALGVLLAGTLAACSGGTQPAAAPTSSSPSPSPSKSAPPVDGGSLTSPLLLVDALSKGGINCTGYEAIAQPRGAVARGSCYVSGEEYTVGIYASAADARAQPDAEAELLMGVAPVDLVLGQNWTVGCPDEPACRKVAEVLGGEVFHEDA